MRFFSKQKADADSKPKPAEATLQQTDQTKLLPLGVKLPVEFTKIQKTEDDKDGKRVVVEIRKIRWRGSSERYQFIQRGKALHYVDLQRLRWEPKRGHKKGFWKLQYDETICEPLDKDGNAHYHQNVATILRDETMMQLVTIAQMLLPLTITRQMVYLMAVFSVIALFIGLGVNEIFHTAPTTIVSWLPSAPKVVNP